MVYPFQRGSRTYFKHDLSDLGVGRYRGARALSTFLGGCDGYDLVLRYGSDRCAFVQHLDKFGVIVDAAFTIKRPSVLVNGSVIS